MAARGRFKPKNPGKYLGNANNVFFRSSWEIRAMQFFDSSPGVLKWGSEEIKIPYIKPTDGRIHYYFPDFVIIYKDKDGQIKKEIIEIKPLKETVLTPKSTPYDVAAYAVNQAKWKAATAFAMQHGMTFRVLTEESLFKKSLPKKKKLKVKK